MGLVQTELKVSDSVNSGVWMVWRGIGHFCDDRGVYVDHYNNAASAVDKAIARDKENMFF